MIHETLFCLWNSPDSMSGDLEWTNLFELQEFLHPGEKKLLQRILEIAMDYHRIVAFNNKILTRTVSTENITSKATTEPIQELNSRGEETLAPPSGLYIKAFCSGVHKVLEGYRKGIINLEETFLQNPQLSLTFILSSIEQYRTLFNVLKSMIHVIKTNSIHGCLLIGRLHKYLFHGMDTITAAAEQIICSINVIFYHHLRNWVIYGNIDDINGEFFICDGNCMDENFLYLDQMTESLTSSATINTLYRKTRIKRPPMVRKFFIKWNMVPSFINEDTAESILFMGRIVWIVRNDPKQSNDNNYQFKFKRDIWEGKDIEYYKKIEALESQPFNLVQFQATIEECRIKLTQYLWTVMLEEGNLMEHLCLIRDYYALGRGELFQQFIIVAEKHFKDSGSDQNIHNLNFIFMETARKIYGENDKSYLRFEFNRNKNDTSGGGNVWTQLQINFEIRWPLHIVFHPKAMELYNKLFNYLLQLKKTQINLNKLWQINVDRRVYTLRQHLMFLVNNLQYYLQVDVIEAQFSLLQKAVQNANEFEDIIKVHHEFISNLLAKTFVLTPNEGHTYENKHRLYQIPAVQFDVPSKIYNVIIRLLELCDEFCLVASTWDSTLTEPAINELEDFKKRASTVVDSLLFILYSLHEKAKGQHLLQLLYQLDFNGYFSKNNPDFNLTVT